MTQPHQPFLVTIVGFNGAFASAITGAIDIFSLTGVSWQRFNNEQVQPRFRSQIASVDGMPFTCSNKITLQADVRLNQVMHTDILLVPTIGGELDSVLANTALLHPELNRLASSGCDMVSNCSGAFLLAEAGLLSGRVATTHWGYASEFSRRYADVKLDAQQRITQDGNIYCAAGGLSFQDMCLMLIERYCGRDAANQVAKAHVINRQTGFQSTFANFHSYKAHRQQRLITVQEYIENHYASEVSTQRLAELINVTDRTLHRQFKQYIGMSPSQYIQAVRIENAKRMLEQDMMSIKSLPSAVGYTDLTSFSRLFKKHTGQSPGQYKQMFRKRFSE